MTETIDLQAWCAKESHGRYLLESPFVLGEWKYATNGKWMVRVPAHGETTTGIDPKRLPGSAADHFNGIESRTDWQPWPEASPITGMASCDTCDGEGATEFKDCDECDGTGDDRCECCGNIDECDVCGGEGTVAVTKCPDCKGKGKLERPCKQPIGLVRIAVEADSLVRGLESPEFACIDTDGPVYVRFSGGYAVVMPIAEWTP